jgi:hypothetical protein
MKRFTNILAAGTILTLGLVTAAAAPPAGRPSAPVKSITNGSPNSAKMPTAPADARDRRVVITDGASIRNPITTSDGNNRRIVITDGTRIRTEPTLPTLDPRVRITPTPPVCPPATCPISPVCRKPICRPRLCEVVGSVGRGFTPATDGGYAAPVFEESSPLPPLTQPGGGSIVTPSLTSPAAPTDVASTIEVDVELVEVKFVDAGDGETNGPLYRVWVANNSKVDVTDEFNVGILVSASRKLSKESPRTMVRVKGLKGGEVRAVDVRLPVEALKMGTNADGKDVPFTWLVAVADSHEELKERNVDNNLLQLQRDEIALVEKK